MSAALAIRECGGAAPQPRPHGAPQLRCEPDPANPQGHEATRGAAVSTLQRSCFQENAIQQALRRAVDGQDAPIQRIAHAVGKPVGTVKGWWYGETTPGGEALILLMIAFPSVFEAVVARVGAAATWRPDDPDYLARVLAGAEGAP